MRVRCRFRLLDSEVTAIANVIEQIDKTSYLVEIDGNKLVVYKSEILEFIKENPNERILKRTRKNSA